MIKINLIQKGSSQKKAIMGFAGEIFIFALILISVAVGMFAYTGILNGRIDNINTRIQREREEQNRLKTVIEKVNELRRAAEIYERRVSIIQELKEQQQGPANLMRALVEARPDNLQLMGVREQRGTIRMTGRATNSFAAANFVRDLRTTELFSEVDILRQTISRPSGVSYDVYDFEIVCKLKSGM